MRPCEGGGEDGGEEGGKRGVEKGMERVARWRERENYIFNMENEESMSPKSS